MRRALKGVPVLIWSATTSVPWSRRKVPPKPPCGPLNAARLRAPEPVLTIVAVSSAIVPPWPSSRALESSGWAKATVKAPVSIVRVLPGATGARTLEASDETPGAAANLRVPLPAKVRLPGAAAPLSAPAVVSASVELLARLSLPVKALTPPRLSLPEVVWVRSPAPARPPTMARSLPPWSSERALLAAAVTVTVWLSVTGAPATSRRRVVPARALRAVPAPRAAVFWTTRVAPSAARLTEPAKVLAPARTKVPEPDWVRLPPVRPLPAPVVAAMTPATVRVVPAAGAKAPPVSRSRATPRLAESVTSAEVARAPLVVSVRAAGVTEARAAPRADSSAMASLPPLTAIAPAKAEPEARLVWPAPRKVTLPEPASGAESARAPPPLAIVLTPPKVNCLAVAKAAPPRLRAKVPPLRAISPPGSALALSRRTVAPPPMTRPAVEASVPFRASVPLLTTVAPA